ncbi:hypothetical protein K488DRAFT_87881 [Vararia minispora EC-137]|uniref:Uncharacterized protein n=1 Tax=Vararia minispora EC-137 TaxID=1314806 RepID=A0ACB8QF54_9AGAM|nr:hypothetical protein K488DRAFT_87881 [Vararia minispora EC-137]
MSAAFNRVRTRLSLGQVYQLHPELFKKPLYEARPKWWMKYSWVGALGGLFSSLFYLSLTMAELIWREWGRKPDDTDSEDAKAEGWVLRPAWQRGAGAGVHVALGLGLVALVVATRNRVVHRLHIIPPDVAPELGGPHRRLFIQSVWDGRGGGIVPFQSTSLYPGRDDTEVILRVEGKRGHWWIGTKDAKVEGEEAPAERIRELLAAMWGIKKGDGAGIGKGTVMSQTEKAKRPAARLVDVKPAGARTYLVP